MSIVGAWERTVVQRVTEAIGDAEQKAIYDGSEADELENEYCVEMGLNALREGDILPNGLVVMNRLDSEKANDAT